MSGHAVCHLPYSYQRHAQGLVGSSGRLKIYQFRGFPAVVYLHSFELKAVGMDVDDGDVELHYSGICPISNKEILAEPQLSTSKFCFLLCHWVS